MKISYNDLEFDNIQWENDRLIMQTDMTLAEIEETFALGENINLIIIYDGDDQVARYYNKGIDSLQVTSANPRTVVVRFNLTQLDTSVESEIRENMEDSDEAIVELAELISDLYDSTLTLEEKVETLNDAIGQVQLNLNETDNRLTAQIERVNSIAVSNGNTLASQISSVMQVLNEYATRISALENKGA